MLMLFRTRCTCILYNHTERHSLRSILRCLITIILFQWHNCTVRTSWSRVVQRKIQLDVPGLKKKNAPISTHVLYRGLSCETSSSRMWSHVFAPKHVFPQLAAESLIHPQAINVKNRSIFLPQQKGICLSSNSLSLGQFVCCPVHTTFVKRWPTTDKVVEELCCTRHPGGSCARCEKKLKLVRDPGSFWVGEQKF